MIENAYLHEDEIKRMKKSERSCENCKAKKNAFCLGRSGKHARECSKYKSVCPKCKGTGFVAIGDGIRGMKPCPYCISVRDFRAKTLWGLWGKEMMNLVKE